MFDKFGEFDSAEEINRAAAAQLAENDHEAIIAIAEENGIDREDAEDYIDGLAPELTNTLMAACGKLKIEAEELKLNGVIKDWKESIVQQCSEDEKLRIAVRRKGKNLTQCLGNILYQAFNNKNRIDDKIVKAANLRTPLYIGIPSRAELKQIITDYYTK